jgi:hypothetical protein
MQKARLSVLVRAFELPCPKALIEAVLKKDQYSFFGNCIERIRL